MNWSNSRDFSKIVRLAIRDICQVYYICEMYTLHVLREDYNRWFPTTTTPRGMYHLYPELDFSMHYEIHAKSKEGNNQFSTSSEHKGLYYYRSLVCSFFPRVLFVKIFPYKFSLNLFKTCRESSWACTRGLGAYDYERLVLDESSWYVVWVTRLDLGGRAHKPLRHIGLRFVPRLLEVVGTLFLE